jgi:hypothetical protein
MRRRRRVLRLRRAWGHAGGVRVERHSLTFVSGALSMLCRAHFRAGHRWTTLPGFLGADPARSLALGHRAGGDAWPRRFHSPTWSRRHLARPAVAARGESLRFEDAAVSQLAAHASRMDRVEAHLEQRLARSTARMADQVLPGRRCRPTWTVSLLTCTARGSAAGAARDDRRCAVPATRLAALRR